MRQPSSPNHLTALVAVPQRWSLSQRIRPTVATYLYFLVEVAVVETHDNIISGFGRHIQILGALQNIVL